MKLTTRDLEVQQRWNKWIEALESGEYDQGTESLRVGDAYCCLGVACDVYTKLTGKGRWVMISPSNNSDGTIKKNPIYSFIAGNGESETGELPREVAEFFDITLVGDIEGSTVRHDDQGFDDSCLSGLNDGGAPFKQIAWLLKTHPEKLSPYVEIKGER